MAVLQSFSRLALLDLAQPTTESSILFLLRRFYHTQDFSLHAQPILSSCSTQVSSTEGFIINSTLLMVGSKFCETLRDKHSNTQILVVNAERVSGHSLRDSSIQAQRNLSSLITCRRPSYQFFFINHLVFQPNLENNPPE